MKTDVLPSIFLYSKHPWVIQTVVAILPRSCSLVHSVPRSKMSEHSAVSYLLVDVCSVSEWQEAVGEWTRERGGASIILVPRDWDPRQHLGALYLGVNGIIPFSQNLQVDILRAMKSISEGRLWVSRAALAKYVEKTRSSQRANPGSLTIREEQTIDLIRRGLPNKTISDILRISEPTVKFHISNVLQKYDVNNRRELVIKLYRDTDFDLKTEFQPP